MVKTARSFIVALLLAAVTFGMAGCSDEEAGGSDDDLRAELATLQDQIEAATQAAAQHPDGLVGEMAAMRREVLLLSAAMLENRLIAKESGVPAKLVAPARAPDPARAEQLLRHIAATEEALEKAHEEAGSRDGVAGSLSQTALVTQELTLAQLRLAYFQSAYGLALPGEGAAEGAAGGVAAAAPLAPAPAPTASRTPTPASDADPAPAEGPRDVGALIGSVKSRGSDRDPAVLPPLEEVTVPQLPPATYDRNDYARIQLLLEEAGHSPGPVDGQWGPRTQRALAAFQSDQGLRPSGKPDAATLDALGFY